MYNERTDFSILILVKEIMYTVSQISPETFIARFVLTKQSNKQINKFVQTNKYNIINII